MAKVYEYTVAFKDSDLDKALETLNEMGRKGWKVCGQHGDHAFFMMREYQPNPDIMSFLVNTSKLLEDK